MSKVYVVTSGEYSDYGIKRIFSTKEKADEYIRIMKEYNGYDSDEFNEIEIYDLDKEIKIPPHDFKFKHFYEIHMDKEGNVVNEPYNCPMDFDDPKTIHEYFRFSRYNGNISILRATINAKDPEHAIKIVGEKRRRLIAENRWLEPNDIQGFYQEIKI